MENQEKNKEIGIRLNIPLTPLVFVKEGIEVIRVNSIFNELPDGEKELILNDLEKWIVKNRKT